MPISFSFVNFAHFIITYKKGVPKRIRLNFMQLLAESDNDLVDAVVISCRDNIS